MKRILHLAARELRLTFFSPLLLLMGAVFMIAMGGLFWLLLQQYSTEPQTERPLLILLKYAWIPTLILTPFLGAHGLGDDRTNGTLESLLATPLTGTHLIFSKFFALFSYLAALWGLLFLYLLWAQTALSDDFPNIFYLPQEFLGGLTYLLLTGAFYLALTLLIFTLFSNEWFAGTVTFLVLFLLMPGYNYASHLLPHNYRALLLLQPLDSHTLLFESVHRILDPLSISFYALGSLLFLLLASLLLRPLTLH